MISGSKLIVSFDIKKGQICILLMKTTTNNYPLDFSHCSNHSSTNIEYANSSGSGSYAISLQYENILALNVLTLKKKKSYFADPSTTKNYNVKKLQKKIFNLFFFYFLQCFTHRCLANILFLSQKNMLFCEFMKLTSACRNILYISGKITGATCPICVSVTSCVNSVRNEGQSKDRYNFTSIK